MRNANNSRLKRNAHFACFARFARFGRYARNQRNARNVRNARAQKREKRITRHTRIAHIARKTRITRIQLQTKDKAATIQGHALKVGEQRKMAAHGEECKEAGINFIPIVVETLGGWSIEAIQTIADIGRLQGQRLGITPGDSIRHLFQRLAISLWRGNATLWLNRFSTSPPRVDGFV